MTDDTWVVVRVQGHHDQPFPSLRRLVATWNAHNADSRFSVREPGADFDDYPLDEGELEYDPHETRSASMSGRHNYEPDGLHEAAAAISRRFPLLEVEVGSAGETSNRYDVRYVAGERSAVRHGDGEWYPTKLLPLMAAVRAAIAEDGHGVLIDASRALVDAIDTAQGREIPPRVPSPYEVLESMESDVDPLRMQQSAHEAAVRSRRERGAIVYPIARAQDLGGDWIGLTDEYLGISTSGRLLVIDSQGVGFRPDSIVMNDGKTISAVQVATWTGNITPVTLESVLANVDWDRPRDLADVVAVGGERLEANHSTLLFHLNDSEGYTAQPDVEAYQRAMSGTVAPEGGAAAMPSATEIANSVRRDAGVELPDAGTER